MKKTFLLIVIFLFACGPSEEEIQARVDEAVEEALNSPTTLAPTTTSSTTTLAPTTTSSTTTLAPTTTSSTVYQEPYDSTIYILRNLTGMENNPYLCEKPDKGVRTGYNWGRCLPYSGSGPIPNYDVPFSAVPAWYNGITFTSEDPSLHYSSSGGSSSGGSSSGGSSSGGSFFGNSSIIISGNKCYYSSSSGLIPLQGNVYFTNVSVLADLDVYLTSVSVLADLKVYFTNVSVLADRCGVWHIVNNSILADLVVYLTSISVLADITINEVSASVLAGR